MNEQNIFLVTMKLNCFFQDLSLRYKNQKANMYLFVILFL